MKETYKIDVTRQAFHTKRFFTNLVNISVSDSGESAVAAAAAVAADPPDDEEDDDDDDDDEDEDDDEDDDEDERSDILISDATPPPGDTSDEIGASATFIETAHGSTRKERRVRKDDCGKEVERTQRFSRGRSYDYFFALWLC